MAEKISTGCTVLDEILKGGLEAGIITTIYGPSATGKTNICMLSALSMAKTKKIIYIDTEGNASLARLIQLAGKNIKLLDNILILKPTNFMEQKDIFNRLKDMISDKIGIIIVDTISMLYRVELGGNKLYEINQELGKQLSYLLEIARKREIPCLITAQVYNDFDVPGNMKIVGGEIIKYSSKVLIEITIDERSNRTMILRKHSSLPESKIEFKITQNGLEKIKKNFILG